jgi:hypothetical protein
MTQLDVRPGGLPACTPEDLIEEARRRHRRRIQVIAASAILFALVVIATAVGIAGNGGGGGRSGGGLAQAPVSGPRGNKSHAKHAGPNGAHAPSAGAQSPPVAPTPTITTSPSTTLPPVNTQSATTAPVATVVTPTEGQELPSVLLANGDQCVEIQGTAAGFVEGVNLNYSCNSSSSSQFYAGGLDTSSPEWTMQTAPSCRALPYVCTGPLVTVDVVQAQQ